MRYFKEQQYFMLDRVKGWLEKKQGNLYPRVPVLKKLVPQYFDMFKEVKGLALGRRKITFITTSEKTSAREGLIVNIFRMTDVLRTASESTDKRQMPVEARYTRTMLNRASAADLPKMCERVIEEVKKVRDLPEYGLSAGDIKETEVYLEAFRSMKSAPQIHKKKISDNNKTLNKGINECLRFLETKLDPMMRIATAESGELKTGYFGARKVLPRGPGAIREKEKRYRKSRKRKGKNKSN